MVNKKTLELFNFFQNKELEQFLINKEGSHGLLSKQSRIQKAFESIFTYITTRSNSIFTIQNSDRSLSINISNIEEDNDHVTMYLITLSESAETFSIDEVISMERSQIKPIKSFDQSKL